MNPAALVVVALLAGTPAPDFDTQIVPILTRAGCNAGACHGAAAGRGGFRLSLLGGNPAADHEVITEELEGRRINLARPGTSLLLAKPTGALLHGGDVLLDADGPEAARLAAWIAAGAPRAKARRLTHFRVEPDQRVLPKEGDVPLRASARFDDGPIEDVTSLTVFSSADPGAVEVDPGTAVATVRRRGQHTVIARFLDHVVPIRLVLPLSDDPIDLSQAPRAGFIDDHVLSMLEVLRLPVSPPADDAAFLRRVRLDLTGRLPDRAEVESFVVDDAPAKRATLVDRLLHEEAFAEYWTLRFARLFRLHSLPNEPEVARAYHAWLLRQVRNGTALDQVARALLTATGDSHLVGPANFARMAGDARSHAEMVSQVFLGVRLQCANCHNHPLDRWTQDDYHGLAAIFARLDRGREVKVAARGAVTNPRTGEPAQPRIPGDRMLEPGEDVRDEFARWLTAPDNPYFARATVNRLWRALFGRGLVEPADDLRDTNPATHPGLLDRLAADFVAGGFDVRRTLRQIALSETYGRSASTLPGNAADDRFYSHAEYRPLEPEVMADAIADVTGKPDRYRDLPHGTRAVTLVDPLVPAPALDILGRCTRPASCEGAYLGGGLPAKLHLLNGDLVNRKIAADGARLHRLIRDGKTDAEIVTDLYLRALGRRPRPAETAFWLAKLDGAEPSERTLRLEDVAWSLLNCREFMMNH